MLKQHWCIMMFLPSLSCKNLLQSRALIKNPPNTIFLKRQTPSKTTKVVCFKPGDRQPTRISIKNPTRARVLRTKGVDFESENAKWFVGNRMIVFLCGYGYVVQGFRCFPWMVLNFHMTHGLGLSSSTLQLLQNFGNLPMVAKPLYGFLSDAFPIAGSHRIPYICIGVIFQILSWVPLALSPMAARSLQTLSALILLGNLGASVTDVAQDALVAEFGKRRGGTGLQILPQMASSVGAILGNLLLLAGAPPRATFLVFSLCLSIHLALAPVSTEEKPPAPVGPLKNPGLGILYHQAIFCPLAWIATSIMAVPSLSGPIFCYQTRCLNLDPWIIGASRVIGQVLLFLASLMYRLHGEKIPMRKLIRSVQILYSGSLLLDLVLARQVNLRLGVSSKAFALCFAGLSEVVAQFKVVLFLVLFAGLCPVGFEGTVMSLVASIVCLSSVVSGFLGIWFADSIGITSGDYSNLSLGIVVQFVASLVPLLFVRILPNSGVVSFSKHS